MHALNLMADITVQNTRTHKRRKADRAQWMGFFPKPVLIGFLLAVLGILGFGAKEWVSGVNQHIAGSVKNYERIATLEALGRKRDEQIAAMASELRQAREENLLFMRAQAKQDGNRELAEEFGRRLRMLENRGR